MVLILVRAVLLMLVIASAIYIANTFSATSNGAQGAIGIGILLIILALIGLGNWASRKIRSMFEKRPKK